MLLLNYYKALSLHCGLDKSNVNITLMNGTVKEHTNISYAGIIPSTDTSSLWAAMGVLKTDDFYGGIILGTGDVAPALSDYKLSGEMITTVQGSVTMEQEADETGSTITSIITVTNTATSDITIKEVGVRGTTGSRDNIVLYDRTVLDTPVTIPAGGFGQVTYTIRMNYPT